MLGHNMQIARAESEASEGRDRRRARECPLCVPMGDGLRPTILVSAADRHNNRRELYFIFHSTNLADQFSSMG